MKRRETRQKTIRAEILFDGNVCSEVAVGELITEATCYRFQ